MLTAVFLIGYKTGLPGMALGGFRLGPYVMGLAGILACVFLCKALNSSIPLVVSIGAYSASIYLLHGLAMGPVRVLLFEAISTPVVIFPLMAVIVCSAGLFLPIVVQKFLLRPHPLLNTLILGQPVK
jgi:membrane-bound acyltransferase YfiQ involved in biofilm formation